MPSKGTGWKPQARSTSWAISVGEIVELRRKFGKKFKEEMSPCFGFRTRIRADVIKISLQHWQKMYRLSIASDG